MEARKYLKLNDINAYKTAFHLSNYVWNVVSTWDNLARATIGKQFINATDSISANIAEGFGRHFKKDKINFYRISRGSVIECLDWNEKSKMRRLVTKEQYDYIFCELQKLPQSINLLIKYTRDKLRE
ncbi:four helix bundle protein [Chitinophaga japonensis]|uniref:Four helix bundle protein n=1 Tax=Chitinophaga japonensis TaxID=104662 RepID=A0A562SN16_CHIJA|nr:four helix bundle protein [Chitinophaga japonensis]TWI82080.1 four helix bundle protein [Chitinophaga japonensis]